MKGILYNRRGGGRVADVGMTVMNSSAATWPLCRLVLGEDDVVFTFVRKQIALHYEDIAQVTISRSGFVKFEAKDVSRSFAFTGIGITSIIGILQSKGVSIDPAELRKVNVARISVALQAIVVIVVVLTIMATYAR
jgi:hypothetical protein